MRFQNLQQVVRKKMGCLSKAQLFKVSQLAHHTAPEVILEPSSLIS